ncbi:biotin transporter BioY [Methanimicrococcus blatticola]|uniref:Biotin transport system substrate-specific component n=1 Tax=Methanimicrococcus blatticola TaxID=91560 RepID=A0A484F3F4_9EURY|nr:biotin transporter BioY [Methanimicrococcus blatticola]MBZ3935365.1 biotin transporter BioY [Methanimicrococcus blatticola]MCC2508537.1 biotin transporter BioY [Methanimicrococcus blatticola]TDQ67843.1 biotin transport system substrate-specific component [Methanimicrococcus blatticola]
MGEDLDYKDDSVRIKKMVLAALFAALIAVGAYIKIPITPLGVPITLQTFFVLLAAVTLGRNWGTVSIIVYLIVGFIGFPVFAGGNSGLGILFGPTGGYLYSFIFVAFLAGWMSDLAKNKNPVTMFGIAAFGSILILAVGSVHLGLSTDIPMGVAFTGGFVPFFVGDMIKSIAIGLVAPALIKKVNFSAS